MKTPTRIPRRLGGLANCSASCKYTNKTSESDYTTKKSITKSSRPSSRKDQRIKPIVDSMKEVNKKEKPLTLSRSRSDYCIRYSEKDTDTDTLKNDGRKLKDKMSRDISETGKKSLETKIPSEHLPAEGSSMTSNKLLNETIRPNASYCEHCKLCISAECDQQPSGKSLGDSFNVAPPPSGYFLRDDISTEESGFDKKKSYSKADKGDGPQCTFGCNSLSKSQNDDDNLESKSRGCTNRKIQTVDISPEHLSDHGKKRRSKSGSKISPKKKTKKVKKRRTPRNNSIGYGDKSPKKVADDNVRNQTKKNFDLKTGIAFKHFSKNEKSHPFRYKQKILDPSNSKFYQTMGSLPVTMDSVLYYYEPQGKTKGKRNTSQNRNVEKIKKVKAKSGDERQESKCISWRKVCDNRGAVYLNTNGNASTSDIDLSAPEDLKSGQNTPIMTMTGSKTEPFNETTGILAHAQAFQEFHDSSQTELYAKDYSIYSDTLEDSAPNKYSSNKPPLPSKETANAQYGLDLMVDDILQSAFKEEAEYHRNLMDMEDKSERPTGEIGHLTSKTTKSATFSINLEGSNTIDSQQKYAINDDENVSGPISQPINTRPDLIKMCKALKRVSSSSPNLSMARKLDRTLGGKQTINSPLTGESPSRSKSSPNTTKHSSGSQSSRSLQTNSDDVKIPQVQASSKSSSKKSSSLNSAIKGGACGGEIDESLQQKERGRSKTSREDSASGSILRKSKSVPQGEKRTQSQPVKSQRKRKSTGNLKKSQSMSPGPFKASCGTSSHSGQNSGECIRKKSQSSGKKNKKKVRIVVDWHRFQSEHLQKVAGVNVSPKDFAGADYGEEKMLDCDAEAESSCDMEYDVEIESREKPTFDRIEGGGKERLEIEMGRDKEENEEELEKKDDIVCGFSESMKDPDHMKSINYCLIKDTAAIDNKVKTKKLMKTKKFAKSKEEKSNAEKGWDSNFVVKKDDSKTKLLAKRKRYQLRKPGEHPPDKSKAAKNTVKETNEVDPPEERKIDTPVDLEKPSATKLTKQLSPQMSKPPPKPAQMKRPYLSPTGLRRKMPAEVDPRGEGSSVDAPAFNARRESVVRLSKSGPLLSATKPGVKEAAANVPRQRVRQARENFARMSRGKPSVSPQHGERTSQTSPKASRSTDLDIACSKRQPPSPNRGAVSLGKPTRTESKLGPGKPRAKSDTESLRDFKEDVVEACLTSDSPPASPRVLDHNFTDPVEMNVINLGLHWMAQRIMRRLSFFQSKPENEEEEEDPSSPSIESAPIVES